MLKRVIFCLFIIPFIALANVEIEYEGNLIRYDSNPRLSAVLHRLVKSTEFYWHSASLYSLDDNSAIKLKTEVLDLLSEIKTETGAATDKMLALQAIENQIYSWKVATRLNLELDYDLIRIRKELNPRLESGRYVLNLPFRVFTIKVFGAVEKPVEIAHQRMTHVKEYLSKQEIQYLQYADREFVYIVHPNGQVKKVSIGLHNPEHVEIPPGGSIYIPVRELPFSDKNERLNDMVAMLAGSRLQ